MVLTLATSLEQTRRNDYSFSPYIHWGEWRFVMTDQLDILLKRLLAWELLEAAPSDSPPKETFFNLYKVPELMHQRLETLRGYFTSIHILPLPLPLPLPAFGEAAPDDDGAEDDAEEAVLAETVVPIVRQRRQHADAVITLQPLVTRPRRSLNLPS